MRSISTPFPRPSHLSPFQKLQKSRKTPSAHLIRHLVRFAPSRIVFQHARGLLSSESEATDDSLLAHDTADHLGLEEAALDEKLGVSREHRIGYARQVAKRPFRVISREDYPAISVKVRFHRAAMDMCSETHA